MFIVSLHSFLTWFLFVIVDLCFSTLTTWRCVDFNSCWLENSGSQSPHIFRFPRLRNTVRDIPNTFNLTFIFLIHLTLCNNMRRNILSIVTIFASFYRHPFLITNYIPHLVRFFTNICLILLHIFLFNKHSANLYTFVYLLELVTGIYVWMHAFKKIYAVAYLMQRNPDSL